MDNLLSNPTFIFGIVQVVAVLIMSIVAVYIVQRFRDVPDDAETTSEMLSKFREMERQGNLSDMEFRTIKTVLAARMQSKTNETEPPD